MVLCGSIIGQGDNQVIVLLSTKDQSLRPKTVVLNFLRVLRHESAKKNTSLNESESWYSNSFLEANKELYYEGVQLVNGLKFACKLASDANEATNRFETRIVSIATIAESMAKRMPSCDDIAYALASFEIITQCTVEGPFAHDKRFYQVMPVWSTAIGGLPVPNYVPLTMHGHPDRLTNTLSLLRYIKSKDHEFVNLVSILSPLRFKPIRVAASGIHCFDGKGHYNNERHKAVRITLRCGEESYSCSYSLWKLWVD